MAIVDAMQYPLDRLHYAMFQLLLAIAIPVVMVLSRWPGGAYRLEFARYDCQPPTHTESQCDAKESNGSHAESKDAQVRSGQHKYSEQCMDIERKFMQMASSEESNSSWVPLTAMKQPYPITVQGHKDKPFCFRVVFYAPTAPGTAFDLLASVLRRPEWDELTESTKIIESLGPGDAIHYVKMKPVWPTAARDSLLLSHLAKVQANGRPGYLNVSQSVEDARVPEYKQAGIVRMEAGIAGQLITDVTEREREQLGLASGSWCKVVQIADGDLRGWIPKSVIKFIATQALPRSLTKVCKQLTLMTPNSESQLLAGSQTLANSAPRPVISREENQQLALSVHKRPAATSRRSRKWVLWLRVLARYAAPAIIAVVTSLVFQIIAGRRYVGRRR
ncbi:hypothetical protein H4R22_000204 [Coemansia sp. RSA 1290]|nr:hypothetical protein H4R22_000204 [Coemansia sp. RSA 1290]